MEHEVVRTLIDAARARSSSAIERALLAMDALPIPWAWEGCFGVRANGDVVYVDEHAKPIQLESLPDARQQRLATLVYAAKRNPDLACLLPKRPENVAPCPTCHGTGTVTKIEALCGECIGLGWSNAA